MDSLQATRMIGGNAGGKRAESDFYPTPPDVTEALLRFLDLPPYTCVWEPACGDGHMSKVMMQHDLVVIESDLKYGQDFLTLEDVDCDWIITNPPFSIADKFVERCIASGKPFALLLKSQYWHAKKRLSIFREHPPTFVCPLTWRPDFLFEQDGNHKPLMDVMWVIWERGSIVRYVPLERPERGVTNG